MFSLGDMVHTDRIVLLVDADCFYCQVEEKLDPSLQGKPIAVVQFNAWRDGGIIAVNYAARDKGCTKGMWMNEAQQKCPEIRFARVTNVRGRADLTKYRDASKKVADVLLTFTQNIERASIDESYIDVTDLVIKRLENGENSLEELTVGHLSDTHVVGSELAHFLGNLNEYNEFTETNCRLGIGGLIAKEMRDAIFQKTGYKCSAGIAHNKILAKLACGFHKPNQQTILPADAVPELFRTLPLKKIKRLGGKFGTLISEKLQITNVGDILKFTEKELAKKFDDKTAKWLYNIARGIDLEPVTSRIISKSISCCKRFPFKYVLRAIGSVEHWLNELAIEITDRLEQELEENNRRARQITVSFAQEIDNKTVSGSKTFPITCYKQEKIFRDAFEIVKKNVTIKSDGSLIVNFLGLCAGSFQGNKKNNIVTLFKNVKNEVNNKHEFQSKVLDSEQVFGEGKSESEISSQSKDLLEDSDVEKGQSTSEENQTSHMIENIRIKFNFDESSNSFDELDDTVEEDHPASETSSFITDTDNNDQYVIQQIGDNNLESSLSSEKPKESGGEYVESNQLAFTGDSGSNEEENGSNSESLRDQYSKSFFLNYLSNISKKKTTLSRNYSFEMMQAMNSSLGGDSKSPPKATSQEFETCLHCRKIIPASEMVSHMDYHFAMQLSNDERSSKGSATEKKSIDKQKNLKYPASSSKRTTTRSNSKAKKRSLENTPITSFLGKIESLDDSNSEVCDDCRKRVRFDDFESHSDYHAAKKLHSEINFELKNTSQKDLTTTKSATKNGTRTSKDISSFFKRT